MDPSQNPHQDLLMALRADPSLSAHERQQVEQMVSQPDFITKLMYGAFGASLAYIVSKYLKLSKTAQILLAVAGFGIGRLLLDASNKHSDKFSQYNNRIKLYEVNNTGNQGKAGGSPREAGFQHPGVGASSPEGSSGSRSRIQPGTLA